jgi:hypothetical protein
MKRTYLATSREPRFYPTGPFPQSSAEQIELWRKRMEAQYRFELDPQNRTVMREFDAAHTDWHNSIQPLIDELNRQAAGRKISTSSIFKLAAEQHLAEKAESVDPKSQAAIQNIPTKDLLYSARSFERWPKGNCVTFTIFKPPAQFLLHKSREERRLAMAEDATLCESVENSPRFAKSTILNELKRRNLAGGAFAFSVFTLAMEQHLAKKAEAL